MNDMTTDDLYGWLINIRDQEGNLVDDYTKLLHEMPNIKQVISLRRDLTKMLENTVTNYQALCLMTEEYESRR
jgi:hypothetical protein